MVNNYGNPMAVNLDQDNKSLKLANDSGFPLQIALQTAVDATSEKHGWTVRLAENSWRNETDGLSGFTDLILSNRDGVNLLVECKRSRNATWLFMAADGTAIENIEANAWSTHYDGTQETAFNWQSVQFLPASPICFFCAVNGQNANDKSTLLERTASELISATEAFAVEDRNRRASTEESARYYLNAIVTTARLELATFSPSDISLEDGIISKGEVKEVPFVRFRKQLSTRATAIGVLNDWTYAFSKENTVLVIQAKHFTNFLQDFLFISGYRGHGGM